MGVAIAFALSVRAGAQVPVGAEFRVDTAGALLHSFVPRALAPTPDGFVAAWETPGSDVAARRFAADGSTIGVEFQVNTSQGCGSSWGCTEQVVADAAGNFLVVWATGQDVYGRLFLASGTPVGPEFRVNEATQVFTSFLPSVAMRPSGEFVVTWSGSVYQNQHVFARRFSASGAPIGADFQVTTSPLFAGDASVDVDGAGNFVVTWCDFTTLDLWAQRFDAAGTRIGAEIGVAVGTPRSFFPRIASWADGRFIVTWRGETTGDDDLGIIARRFASDGQPSGSEFRVNVYTTGPQYSPSVDVHGDGSFTFAWASDGQDGHAAGIFGRVFSASGQSGPEFQVNTATTGQQRAPAVAARGDGGFVVAWHSSPTQTGPDGEMRAQRYERTLVPAALAVDATASPDANGNGVFEAGEVVEVAPSWSNVNLVPHAFTGSATAFTGPGTSGDPAYTIADGAADYGSVGSGATASCTSTADCYALGISVPTVRPAVHWDAVFHEEIAPASLGATKDWTLHVGDSFSDVPPSNPFYRFVETLLHHGVTSGCTTTTYCPAASTTREQMAVFVLVAKEGGAYSPPACTTPMFADVPATSPYCRWIEELARRGVVAGCGGGNYCPTGNVTREQMAVFVLRTLDGTLNPPACGTPVFDDVPATSPYCRWIEELARRGVVTGCGGGAYCPTSPVTREQMGVFLSVTFGLQLYRP